MDVKIIPGKLRGRITAMPSKSHAHRVLIAQKLAQLQGTSCRDPLFIPEFSRDITATKNCLAQLDRCAGADHRTRTGDDIDAEGAADRQSAASQTAGGTSLNRTAASQTAGGTSLNRTAASQTAGGSGISQTAASQTAGDPAGRRNTTDSAAAADSDTDIPLLDCGESGSTLRFMLPVAMAVTDNVIFAGSGKLPQRPISPLKEEMENHGCVFTMGAGRAADINKTGITTDNRSAADNSTDSANGGGATEICTITGRLQPGEYTLPGNISSQFITGLLFALPILDGDSSLRLTTKLESAGYVDLSLDVLRDFGIDIRIDTDENGFITYGIKGGQKYKEPEGLSIEGDWSNAAFWLACGALGGDIICDGLKADSSQRDREVLTVLQNLGAEITTETGADGLTTVICRAPGNTGIGGDEATGDIIPDHGTGELAAACSTDSRTAPAVSGIPGIHTQSGDNSDDHMCAARRDSHASDRRTDECISEDRSISAAAPDNSISADQAADNSTDCRTGDHSSVSGTSGNGSPQTPTADDPAQAAGRTVSGLTAIDLDVTQIPDLVPVLAAVMSAAEGNSVITGAERLRIKESDRLETVRDFLSRLGADIECLEDGLSITGRSGLAGGEVSSHNDHRIAMAAAVASCICRGPVIIRGSDAVSKSYPDFFSDFAGLGGTVNEV